MRRLAAGALVALVAYRLRTSYLKERAKIVRIADVPEPARTCCGGSAGRRTSRSTWRRASGRRRARRATRRSTRSCSCRASSAAVSNCGGRGACYGRGWFRERLWGGLGMARAAVKNISCWLDHISLNATTGLDRDGHEVRAALGWSGAEYFAPG
ncbi:O-acyltransferase [Aureococcus anophagefferens]|nr:O-acyltransferase [Aureococcus anophagefferens]